MRINKPKYLILHHEGAWNGFDRVNEWHRKKWNFKSSLGDYIAYQYYITHLGKVIQGRADTDEGIHCKGMNLKSIGICLEGNFSHKEGEPFPDSVPTSQQLNSLKQLLWRLMTKYNIPLAKIVPHRHFKATECYGLNLKDDFGQRLAYQEIQKYPKEDIRKELLRTQIKVVEKILKLCIRLYDKLFG